MVPLGKNILSLCPNLVSVPGWNVNDQSPSSIVPRTNRKSVTGELFQQWLNGPDSSIPPAGGSQTDQTDGGRVGGLLEPPSQGVRQTPQSVTR